MMMRIVIIMMRMVLTLIIMIKVVMVINNIKTCHLSRNGGRSGIMV